MMSASNYGLYSTKNVVTGVLAIAGIYLVATFIRKCYKIAKIRKSMAGIPNKPHILFGHMHKVKGPGPDIFRYTLALTEKYNKIVQFWFGPFYPSVMLTHPDTAKIVMKSSEPKIYKQSTGSVYRFFVDWMGDGLILSTGPKWLRNRRLLTPAFHFEILKPYLKVYEDADEKFFNKMEELGENGKTSVPIYSYVSLLTLDIILKCAFSYHGDIQGQGKNDPYIASVLKLTELIVQRLFSPLLHNNLIYHMTPYGWQYRKALNYVHNVSNEVIQKRKQAIAENRDADKKRYLDFLDILLAARDDEGQGLTDTEIREEVGTFLFAGHDTTASAISWTIYELAKHPEIQEQARQEILNVMASKDNPDIEREDLLKMQYLNQCIKETLRLDTPVPVIGRQLTKDIVIDGHTVSKGTEVALWIYCIHHNPTVWGNDHMEYKPERFDPDNMKNMDPYAFVPFSAGPRNCIGQNFSMNEQMMFFAKLLQRFEVSIDPNHKVDKQPESVTRPTNDIKIFFTPLK